MTNPQTDDIRNSFQNELNLHGYGFQFSVLKSAQDLARATKSKWSFRVSEFPVEVRGVGTKIDFVLFRQPYSFWRADMICECKRANPALSNWCFIRAPYIHRNHGKTPLLILESAIRSTTGELRVFAKAESTAPQACHIGLAIKAKSKGDAEPVKQNTRSQIEDAATQVLRGVNGYIEMLAANPQLIELSGQDAIVRIVPVVFTTANLWVSNADLSTSDLSTGKVTLEGSFENVPWLWYQYNVSPGLKHIQRTVEKQEKIEEHMVAEHIRSIAIVSPTGIADFLEQTSESL